MSRETNGKSTPMGIYDKPKSPPITGVEKIALALSALWLLGAAVFFVMLPSEPAPGDSGSLRFVMTMLAVFMPVAMIWVAATTARASRVMREESQRLQAAIDAIRQAYVAQNQGRHIPPEPSVTRKLDEIAAATRKTETTLASFSTTRDINAPVRKPPTAEPDVGNPADQPSLALGTRAEEIAPPLDRVDFIRALNFPENSDDKDGFDALRNALQDRKISHLIQAAQDVLTLLSQDGIYMDDLRPDVARPEIWRAFANGERGRSIAALGGVRDRSSLALSAARMKQDAIFRDAAHHFLRRFDKSFADFEEVASDADIVSLAGTRTARAFMLLGRVAGTFD